MPAGILHLTVEQGTTYSQRLTWKINSNSVNLTGYTARMKVRTPNRRDKEPLISLTSAAGGGITLGGSAGTIDIAISATSTATLVPAKYTYDLELVSSSGAVTRLVKGTFTVVAEVTY